MKTITTAVLFTLVLISTAEIQAQAPNIEQLTSNIDRAAVQLGEQSDSFFGFKKLKMPKPFEGLLDVRFKKPQLPKFGLLEKLKNIGKPSFDSQTPTTGPIMAGLGKLFQPPARTGPSFLDRMFGSPASEPSEFGSSVFSGNEGDELSHATKGLQDHVGRMSREVKMTATELFSGQSSSSELQPPLRSARQYSGQTQSPY